MNRRRGYSLVELMVALVIAGFVGVALTRLVINQARFISLQDGMMRARSGSRAAYNMLAHELTQVTDGGLVAANGDSITLRLPYAFGIACAQTGGTTIVAVIPTDSTTFFNATPSGYAWRDSLGVYRFENGATISDFNAAQSNCTSGSPAISVTAGPGWSARAIAVSPNNLATPRGGVVYLYQTIQYALTPSVELPGTEALWRTPLATGVREELVAPFDTSSRFQFVIGPGLTLSATPGALTGVRGIRAVLVGMSERVPQGKAAAFRFDLQTNLLFRNVP